MSKIMYKDKQIMGCISDAQYVAFNNTNTGLSATNVQNAITEVNSKLEPIKLYDGSLGANESTTLSHHITDFNKIMLEVTIGGSLIITLSIIVDNRSSIATAYYITDTMFIHISINDTIIRLGSATRTNMKLTKIFAYIK